MRAPGRRRPRTREIGPPPEQADLDALADRARYIGSPEHKDTASFAGPPRLPYRGRLVNREAGEYKGYPLDRDEWPAGIEEIYANHVRDCMVGG